MLAGLASQPSPLTKNSQPKQHRQPSPAQRSESQQPSPPNQPNQPSQPSQPTAASPAKPSWPRQTEQPSQAARIPSFPLFFLRTRNDRSEQHQKQKNDIRNKAHPRAMSIPCFFNCNKKLRFPPPPFCVFFCCAVGVHHGDLNHISIASMHRWPLQNTLSCQRTVYLCGCHNGDPMPRSARA